jgi:hypothetical protein
MEVPANRDLEDRWIKQNGQFEDEQSMAKYTKYSEGLNRLHQAIVRIDTTVMLFNNFSS